MLITRVLALLVCLDIYIVKYVLFNGVVEL